MSTAALSSSHLVPAAPPAPRSHSRAPSRPRSRPPAQPIKRLIVAADGTWLNSDNGLMNGELSVPSNVTRISRAIKEVSSDGIPQVVYYHFGVGSRGGPVDRFVQGTTGEGLEENVREGYTFLATNYSYGDEIFLFGFSRGAFTVRSIAGLIGEIGLLTKRGLPYLHEVYKDVLHRRDPDYRPKYPDMPFPNKPSANDPLYRDELERLGLTRLGVTVKVVGVWDTVGSLGVPRVGWLTRLRLQSQMSKETTFHDTKLSDCIENAFQALALDERRSAFSPAVWEKPPGNKTTLRQVWFPGVHSNVGGGYDDQQLANISLAWMMAQLEPFLDMRTDYLLEEDEENVTYYQTHSRRPRPWSFGRIVNSMTGLYALGGGSIRTPGRYKASEPETGRLSDRPLRETHEYVHPSVRSRLFLRGPGIDDRGDYACPALADWRLVVDYDTTRRGPDGEPDVFWKLRRKDPNASTSILPEAPLWGIERKLAMTDPQTYDYITMPPASRKRGRRRRGGGGGGGPPSIAEEGPRASTSSALPPPPLQPQPRPRPGLGLMPGRERMRERSGTMEYLPEGGKEFFGEKERDRDRDRDRDREKPLRRKRRMSTARHSTGRISRERDLDIMSRDSWEDWDEETSLHPRSVARSRRSTSRPPPSRILD